jgi:hypothetical protein
MVQIEDRLAYVAERAYALARTGIFEDSAAIEHEIAAEGFADEAHWLERPGVREALDEICIVHRQPLTRN